MYTKLAYLYGKENDSYFTVCLLLFSVVVVKSITIVHVEHVERADAGGENWGFAQRAVEEITPVFHRKRFRGFTSVILRRELIHKRTAVLSFSF